MPGISQCATGEGKAGTSRPSGVTVVHGQAYLQPANDNAGGEGRARAWLRLGGLLTLADSFLRLMSGRPWDGTHEKGCISILSCLDLRWLAGFLPPRRSGRSRPGTRLLPLR